MSLLTETTLFGDTSKSDKPECIEEALQEATKQQSMDEANRRKREANPALYDNSETATD